MNSTDNNGNIILLRGAGLWILVTLVLAWCLVGLGFNVSIVKAIFPGKFTRVLQAHIDFLLMSALLLGFYGARIPLRRLTQWAMTIGAFTNSSLFLLMAMFPIVDYSTNPPPDISQTFYRIFLFMSLTLTTFGFSTAAITVLRASRATRD